MKWVNAPAQVFATSCTSSQSQESFGESCTAVAPARVEALVVATTRATAMAETTSSNQ